MRLSQQAQNLLCNIQGFFAFLVIVQSFIAITLRCALTLCLVSRRCDCIHFLCVYRRWVWNWNFKRFLRSLLKCWLNIRRYVFAVEWRQTKIFLSLICLLDYILTLFNFHLVHLGHKFWKCFTEWKRRIYKVTCAVIVSSNLISKNIILTLLAEFRL